MKINEPQDTCPHCGNDTHIDQIGKSFIYSCYTCKKDCDEPITKIEWKNRGTK